MTKETKVNAAILIIGNEILSGRTQDTNTSTLATWLNSIGVKVGEVRVIADIEEIIISTLNHLRNSYNYVFTTGGIGPTHDDITAERIYKRYISRFFPSILLGNLKIDYNGKITSAENIKEILIKQNMVTEKWLNFFDKINKMSDNEKHYV